MKLVFYEHQQATRGKWRILDGNVESGLDHKFRATWWLPPATSIELYTDAYGHGSPINYVAQRSLSWRITYLASWMFRRDSIRATCDIPPLSKDG
jgi:hypothetical protein